MSLGYGPTLGHSERGKRQEGKGASSQTSAHDAHMHRCRAESDNAMWRKAVISVFGSRLLNHIELKGANVTG